MSLYTTVRPIINRFDLFTLAGKRKLRAIFTEVSDLIATNTTNLTSLTTEVQLVGRDAVVATADGLTTGLIPATAHYAQVTSSVATKQVSLPAAVDGKHLYIMCFTNGCELISAVAADKVNDVVVGATNEGALVANTLYSLTYTNDDGNWVMTGLDKLGAVETPVVPDAL